MKRNAWYKRLSASGGIVSELNALNVFRRKEKKKCFPVDGGLIYSVMVVLKRERFQTLTGLVPAFPPPPQQQQSNCEEQAAIFPLFLPPKGKGGCTGELWITLWRSRFECCRHAKRLWWLNDSLRHEPCNLCTQYLKTLSSKHRLKKGKRGFFRFITRIKPEARGPPDNILLTPTIDTKAWEPQQFDSSQVQQDPTRRKAVLVSCLERLDSRSQVSTFLQVCVTIIE